MTANSEFQASLQAGKVNEAIAQVISRLVELDIVTVLPATEGSAGQNTLSTKVNLLTGKITNEIGAEFLQNKSYAKFLNFHTAQIDATSQMVREQLHGLQALIRADAQANANGNTSGVELPPLPKLAKPIATIETPKASTDTMPVQAPPIDLPAPNPEPPVMVSPVSAEATKVVPNTALAAPEVPPVEAVTLADALDKAAAPQTPPANPSAPIVATVERISPSPVSEPQLPSPAIPNPATTIVTVSAVSAAIAQAGSPDLSEASAIPNKLDQAMRSAGVKPEVEDQQHPFDSEPVSPQVVGDGLAGSRYRVRAGSSVEIQAPEGLDHPSANLDRELIDLLNDPNEQWDEWLLEEDTILSELSQVSQDATKAKIPDLEDDWFAQPVSRGEDSGMDDWEKFIPEYTDPNSATNKGQANVERFRQNLVNDPQLMNELLAELDDIEHLGEGKSPGNQPKSS
jgi:hypothetical protein